MARRKQATPLRREPSDFDRGPPESPSHGWKNTNGGGGKGDGDEKGGGQIQARPAINGAAAAGGKSSVPAPSTTPAGTMELVVCVAGIYVSFLTWALLQERITTTPYGPASSPVRFTHSVFLNTIQSAFAALTGYLYLLASSPSSTSASSSSSSSSSSLRWSRQTAAIFPSRAIFFPLVLVALTSSLASPFGYAALAYIDYITFILAKSCKLLPVMALHLTIFRTRYPVHKYLVVALVTAGVAVFTIYHPSTSKKISKSSSSSSSALDSAWGLFLLAINLLFDGLTNSTQDHIFATYAPYSGPQMMVAQNVLATLLTASYLLLTPFLPPFLSSPLSPSSSSSSSYSSFSGAELPSALSFLRAHPSALPPLFLFCACGAVGQIFIFHTLSRFSSLLLVTVTVTRKMLTMLLSVVWFGHHLSGMQWVGVGLVFGGVGGEAWWAKKSKGKGKGGERAKGEKGRQ